MITKILFTILVIALVLGTARYRAARRAQAPLVRIAPPAPQSPWPRRLAYAFSFAMVAGAAAYFWTSWHDRHTVMSIRVINPKSGEETTYQAMKGDIHGQGFVTLDGWSIRVSDAERVEISEAD